MRQSKNLQDVVSQVMTSSKLVSLPLLVSKGGSVLDAYDVATCKQKRRM